MAAREAMRTRVSILSGLRLHGEGLAHALGRTSQIHVLGSTAEVSVAIESVRELRPEVVLVDTTLQGCVSAIRAISRAAPGAEIIALGVPDLESDIVECVEAGVSGYVTRSASMEDLVATIESVTRGEVVCPPRVAATLFKRLGALAEKSSPMRMLTPRELEIMRLIEEGLSNREVAQRLFIEVSTVKNHLHNIFEKLQVHRRTEAVARMRGYESPRTSDAFAPL